MASIVEVPFDEMDPVRLGPDHSMLDEVGDMFTDFVPKQPYEFPWAEKAEGYSSANMFLVAALMPRRHRSIS